MLSIVYLIVVYVYLMVLYGSVLYDNVSHSCRERSLWQLWNTFHRPELLRNNMDTCLKDLGLDYVDHVQLHYSFAMVPVEDEK